MPRKGEIRRNERVPQGAPVQVSWTDRLGNEKFANTEILDVSKAGMRVKVPESLAEHTLVTLRFDRLALHGRHPSGAVSVDLCTAVEPHRPA
jgi:hypothetical protein